ncbi:Low-density lipoprotein (LDL) receptor class A repeat [Trinorchestia longiramus]|nr:Low-density lipoprotein (LDL) receptor class A repeat [Trinorchestia longiramus]
MLGISLRRSMLSSATYSYTEGSVFVCACSRQCTRQQFECHSGECIAIYDACNGIPQCEDGSDEGAELNCPSTQDPTQIRTSNGLASDLLASSGGRSEVGPPHSGVARAGSPGSRTGSEQTAEVNIGKLKDGKIPSLHNPGDLTDLLYGGTGSSRKGMPEGESRGSEGPAVIVTGKGRDGGDEEVRPGYEGAGRMRGADRSVQQQLHQQQGAPYGADRSIFSHRATLLDSYGRYGAPAEGGYSNTEDVPPYGGRTRASGYYDFSANRPPGYAAAPYLGGEYDPRSGYRRGDALETPLSPAQYYPQRPQPGVSMKQWGEPSHLTPLQASAPQQPLSPLQQQQQQHNLQLLPYQQQALGSYLRPIQLPQVQQLQQLPDTQLQPQRQQLIPIGDQMASGGGREVGYGLPDAKHQEELSLFGGRLSSEVNPPLAARPPGIRGYSVSSIPKGASSVNQTSPTNTTSTTTAPILSTLHTSNTSVSSSTPSSTTPTSTTTSDTFSILGAWGSIVAKWKLDPAQIEAEKKENRLQHSGAVVALSLGLTVSAMLLLLIGCRVRGLRRRRHRGGRSSYAHDADYLVNGMYL